MGFKKTITFQGLEVVDAYHRIDVTTSSNNKCTATLNAYVSRDSLSSGEGYLIQKVIEFPISYGQNVGSDKDQGYSYISTLNEYADIENVFEEGQPY